MRTTSGSATISVSILFGACLCALLSLTVVEHLDSCAQLYLCFIFLRNSQAARRKDLILGGGRNRVAEPVKTILTFDASLQLALSTGAKRRLQAASI